MASTDTRRGSTPAGTRSCMTSRAGVVAGDEEDVAPDLVQRRLVDAARAHPVLRLGLAGGRRRPPRAHVAVAEPADAVEQLHVPQVAVGEDLLDRERGRAAGRARRAARPARVIWRVTSSPSRSASGRSVGELVADHEPRRRQRLDAREHALEEELVVVGAGVDGVGALLEGHELRDGTGRPTGSPSRTGSPARARAAGSRCAACRRAARRARRARRRTSARSCAGTGCAASGSTKCSTTATSGPGASTSV